MLLFAITIFKKINAEMHEEMQKKTQPLSHLLQITSVLCFMFQFIISKFELNESKCNLTSQLCTIFYLL